jgi:DNA-binding XRE family transcriptional regulator
MRILPGAFSISPFPLGVDTTSILMYDGNMSYTTEMHHLGFTIMNERTALALSQKELAEKANVTQQQLSKIEQGYNCGIGTLIKVCKAIGYKITLEKENETKPIMRETKETPGKNFEPIPNKELKF